MKVLKLFVVLCSLTTSFCIEEPKAPEKADSHEFYSDEVSASPKDTNVTTSKPEIIRGGAGNETQTGNATSIHKASRSFGPYDDPGYPQYYGYPNVNGYPQQPPPNLLQIGNGYPQNPGSGYNQQPIGPWQRPEDNQGALQGVQPLQYYPPPPNQPQEPNQGPPIQPGSPGQGEPRGPQGSIPPADGSQNQQAPPPLPFEGPPEEIQRVPPQPNNQQGDDDVDADEDDDTNQESTDARGKQYPANEYLNSDLVNFQQRPQEESEGPPENPSPPQGQSKRKKLLQNGVSGLWGQNKKQADSDEDSDEEPPKHSKPHMKRKKSKFSQKLHHSETDLTNTYSGDGFFISL